MRYHSIFLKLNAYFNTSFEFYEEGGPVFLYIGGEGILSDRWLTDGAWLEWAKEQKAALLMLEHRYYGKSHPTASTKTEDLAWLSSRFNIICKYCFG